MQITKNMMLSEILKKTPESAEIFKKYKMLCIGCSGAINESLENGAVAHGIDINVILKEINEITKK